MTIPASGHASRPQATSTTGGCHDNISTAFHIHTYRCGHAGDYPDEAYIRRALGLGYQRIVFTDHAPLPGDCLPYRMRCDELEGYLDSLLELKRKFAGRIDVCCGLEAEYFPWHRDYLSELKEKDGIDLLILGQHFFALTPEIDPDWEFDQGVPPYPDGHCYSLSIDSSYDEYMGLGESICQGISTGLFDVVAHPDRIFYRLENKAWNDTMEQMSKNIIRTAIARGVPLEWNNGNLAEGWIRNEFWDLALQGGAEVVFGLDAHCPDEVVKSPEAFAMMMAGKSAGTRKIKKFPDP